MSALWLDEFERVSNPLVVVLTAYGCGFGFKFGSFLIGDGKVYFDGDGLGEGGMGRGLSVVMLYLLVRSTELSQCEMKMIL